jgi:hypothetical protein
MTLRDAGHYIAKLSKAVHDRSEWQAAAEALLLVVKLGGPAMFLGNLAIRNVSPRGARHSMLREKIEQKVGCCKVH